MFAAADAGFICRKIVLGLGSEDSGAAEGCRVHRERTEQPHVPPALAVLADAPAFINGDAQV
jgi:hypothetical protein